MSETKGNTRVWLTAGTLVKNYKIDARLAASGIGEVYLAQERRSKRVVSFKILPAPLQYTQVQLEALAEKMNQQVMPSHPAICETYEIGVTENGKLFIASEYVHGQSLDTLVNAKAHLEVTSIAEQIAEALNVAHESGLVHADLKMSNVMLTANGKVKLLDFGMGKYRHLWERSEDEQLPSGVRHLSPEHVNGRTLTPQSDLFSLGTILYELVTGVAPFSGETSLKVSAAIVWNQPTAMSELTDNVSAEFSASIFKLLGKDSSQRTVSAPALLAELKQLRVSQAPPPKHFPAAMWQAGQRFLGSDDGQLVAGFGRGALHFVFNDGAGWVVFGLATLAACYALVSFLTLVGIKH
jgi:serine/threonine protein kinase